MRLTGCRDWLLHFFERQASLNGNIVAQAEVQKKIDGALRKMGALGSKSVQQQQFIQWALDELADVEDNEFVSFAMVGSVSSGDTDYWDDHDVTRRYPG